MKKTIKTKHLLTAPANKVWANISQAKGVNDWLPVVTACRLEGHGEGAKRICTTERGDMSETVLKIDNEHKIFRYAIDKQPLLPIDHTIGTMQVIERQGQTELRWNLEYNIEDEHLNPTVEQAVNGMYSAGASGLESISQ